MKNSQAEKNIKKMKELMEVSRYRENRLEILIWGFLVLIGYISTHFLYFSSPMSIPFVWLTIVPIGVASSVILEKNDKKKFGESFSFLQSRMKYIWFCIIAVGLLITYFSVSLSMFHGKFIPSFWFLVIGIALFVEGSLTTLKWTALGIAFILSGTLLVLIPDLMPYWAVLFALVHGGGFILIGLTVNDKNR